MLEERILTAENTRQEQLKQKQYFDRKRKDSAKYAEGYLLLILKHESASGTSSKMLPPYTGSFTVKVVLPNDKYVVTVLEDFHRTKHRKLNENVIAVDRMKTPVVYDNFSSEEKEANDNKN